MLGWAGANAELSGVLLGGYGGAWLETSLLDVPYTPAALSAAGATLGVGVVIALPATSCGLCETARIAKYMAGQSAGQCGPCVFGCRHWPRISNSWRWAAPEPDLVERIWARADAHRRTRCLPAPRWCRPSRAQRSRRIRGRCPGPRPGPTLRRGQGAQGVWGPPEGTTDARRILMSRSREARSSPGRSGSLGRVWLLRRAVARARDARRMGLSRR